MHPVEAMIYPLGRMMRGRRPDAALSIAASTELATPNRISLTSPAFGDGQVIPTRFCGPLIGEEISPALDWDALPSGTEALVLVIEDLDVPSGTPGIHTIAGFAPPAAHGLPEGALTPDDATISFVPNRRGQARYVGPRPLPGHGTHRYRFHLYALDAKVDLATIAGTAEVPAALDGHVLASGTLTGTRTT